MPPELQLLIQVARVELTPARQAAVERLLREPLDWRYLLELGFRHKMLPLLALHLRSASADIPTAVRRQLLAYSVDTARRMLQIVRELVELLARFEAEGIHALPYKGPVLGAQVYGSAVLRQAGDLDLLVRSADVQRARLLLASLGYTPRHVLASGGEDFMLRSRYSETYDHASAVTVELHWAFTNRDIALPLALDDLVPAVEPVRVGGMVFSGFGREDLLLVLCVHGSKHRWDRLEWLCGVSEAVRAASGLDWDALLARATRLGVRRMLLLGLLLAHDLLDAPVQPRMVRLANRDAAVVRAALQVPGFMLEDLGGEDEDNVATDLFRFNLRERWRDRVRFVVYRATTPSRPESWRALRVGAHVLPLHGLARPFRLLSKLVPALRRRYRTP